MEAQSSLQRILVGVDAEGNSANAVLRAKDLAQRLGAETYLAHGVQAPPPPWPTLADPDLSRRHAALLVEARRTVLKSLEDTWPSSDSADDSPEFVAGAHPGHPARVILKQARERSADLILLGAHAKHNLLDFGSTHRAVLSHAEAPVWVQSGEVLGVNTILAAIDFSEHSRAALRFARSIAEPLGARIQVLFSYNTPAFACASAPSVPPKPSYVVKDERTSARRRLDELVEGMDWQGVAANPVFRDGVAIQTVLRESEKADLVIMGTHGRTGLSRYLLGSVAYSVLKRCDRPVVVVPDTGRNWLLDSDSR